MHILSRVLPTGCLQVCSSQSRPLDELFEIAQRRNPKRAFLFVSKVLGRHIPVSPAVARQTYQQLSAQLPADLPSPVLFIGMAETAVGLAAGVFQEALRAHPNALLLTSTRHAADAPLLAEFKEPHSHATDHLLHWPTDPALRSMVERARSWVLIDDEATTGTTMANVYTALCEAGLTPPEYLAAVTLTDWSGDALTEKIHRTVHNISLIQGSWTWVPAQGVSPLDIPVMLHSPLAAQPEPVDIVYPQNWGRIGMHTPSCSLGNALDTQPGRKTLVLGSGEFIWPPFLLAERLEQAGEHVLFGATTRSPIAVGHAIGSALSFADHYGLGLPNYLYNVDGTSFDRICLCVETSAESIDPALIQALRQLTPTLEIISA